MREIEYPCPFCSSEHVVMQSESVFRCDQCKAVFVTSLDVFRRRPLEYALTNKIKDQVKVIESLTKTIEGLADSGRQSYYASGPERNAGKSENGNG